MRILWTEVGAPKSHMLRPKGPYNEVIKVRGWGP